MVSTPTLGVSPSQGPSSHPPVPAPAPALVSTAAVRSGHSQRLQQIKSQTTLPCPAPKVTIGKNRAIW